MPKTKGESVGAEKERLKLEKEAAYHHGPLPAAVKLALNDGGGTTTREVPRRRASPQKPRRQRPTKRRDRPPTISPDLMADASAQSNTETTVEVSTEFLASTMHTVVDLALTPDGVSAEERKLKQHSMEFVVRSHSFESGDVRGQQGSSRSFANEGQPTTPQSTRTTTTAPNRPGAYHSRPGESVERRGTFQPDHLMGDNSLSSTSVEEEEDRIGPPEEKKKGHMVEAATTRPLTITTNDHYPDMPVMTATLVEQQDEKDQVQAMRDLVKENDSKLQQMEQELEALQRQLTKETKEPIAVQAAPVVVIQVAVHGSSSAIDRKTTEAEGTPSVYKYDKRLTRGENYAMEALLTGEASQPMPRKKGTKSKKGWGLFGLKLGQVYK